MILIGILSALDPLRSWNSALLGLLTEPNRAWYSVSSEGLLEAAALVKDFTGNIAGTLGSLTKLLGL